ncbi:unnamed protein product [Anisakis simplex]|uniref:Alpha-1,3-glucosyltransferase n=1 Tax=Anisakis simplex TaxID=6269 RepID=A0A0M3JVP8_ANISI|nr:unnamed protein product [Anisakis simplex]
MDESEWTCEWQSHRDLIQGVISVDYSRLIFLNDVICILGLGTPPMFGDFEAQRHWMELTIHLPIDKWYVNGSDNDLNYWGLDYPPLTAFHSFVLGKLLVHFQYNHVSLGLSLFAVLCLTLRWRVAACALFVMALNFKQMQLYHSLPIAAFLFSTSIHSTSSTLRNITSTFLFSFPYSFDKVANLWCALNVVVKLKGYDATGLIKLSTVCVLCAHIPCILALLLRPDASNFKNALFVSSLSFFLFSFQVHEKSILLAAVPALIIWNDRPVTISWFLIITNCSGKNEFVSLQWTIVHSSCLASVTLCAASLVISPPKRYPDIFPLLNAIFCCAHFVMFLIYFNYLIVTHTYAVIGTDKHRVKLE